MKTHLLPTFILGLLVLTPRPSTAASGQLTFNRDIRPILSDHCFACHGFDQKKRKADLRLDTPEGAYAEHDGSRAIVPGNLDNSALWQRITTSDEDDIMPPPDFHKALNPKQLNTLKRWIEQGAEYEAHWAFVKPVKHTPPKITGAEQPIDAFIQQRLQQEKLKPSPRADRATLIRRATLDLTGLPPTPGEIDAFLADQSPQAWDTLIAELMSRPAYGEHMARYWLDLARYADTHGLHLDNERSMWPYRDGVVRAFNQNIPFDDFTRGQLAGDLLPDRTVDQHIASGFNRCNVTTSEGGSINAEWTYRYAVDRTSTAIEVWMGLTGGCAVCHDHKFDPLSTKEYYSLYAFFHSAADPAMDGNKKDTPPILHVSRPEDEKKVAELAQKIATIDQRISEAVARMTYTDPASIDPPPRPQSIETVWFEDGFPPGATAESTGAEITFHTRDQGPVFSGNRSLTRTAHHATGQDFYSGGPTFTLPEAGTIFAYCYLDPKSPPEAIMLQFHLNGWNHRAVWGAHDKIGWGKAGTHERVVMGALPQTGEWVRLEFPAAKVGLNAGTKITGFALTQFSGTMHWDRFGVSHTTDPATDPAWSWKKWQEVNQGKGLKELPDDLRRIVKGHRANQWSTEQRTKIHQYWLTHVYAGAREMLDPLEAEKRPLEREMTRIQANAPYTFVMADLPKARESFVMLRGQYDNPGEKVSRNVPAFLPPLPERPADRDYNRLDLANWLVSGAHPLTARVTVNRLWQQFFGTGLVKTSADFGSQGEPPSHPELLDWLAVQFVEDGWDIQRFIKRLLASQTYQQASNLSPEALERDPENRLLARGPRFRLDAEVLRDQALFVSGLLVPTIGGKGVRPYQPPNIWEPVGFGNSNTRYYKQDTGDALYRRSLYTFLKRTAPPPFMSSFDAPNREQSCTARGRSNTPMQALQLMNDIQHIEAARTFAQRIIQEAGTPSNSERLRNAWRSVTGRWPSDDESRIVLDALDKHAARYAKDVDAARQLIHYGESKPDSHIDPAELASWTLVANLLLNLDEVVNKN